MGPKQGDEVDCKAMSETRFGGVQLQGDGADSPGGGLGIFTDRDQRSIFWVLNFEYLHFLGTGHSCCIFLAS